MRLISLTKILLICVLGLSACGEDDAQMPAPSPDAGTDAGSGGTSGGSAGSSGTSAGSSGDGGTAGMTDEPFADGPYCQRTGPTRDELADMLEPITGGENADDLLLTPRGLYWRAGTRVYRLGSEGNTGTIVAESDIPEVLANNSSLIAWVATASDGVVGVYTAPLGEDGVTPTFVGEAHAFTTHLAIDDTYVYFDGTAGDGLMRLSIATGESEKLLSTFGIGEMIVQDGSIYYFESLGHSVQRVPVAGGMPETLTPDEGGLLHAFAFDDTAIFTSDEIGINRIERDDAASEQLLVRHASASGQRNNSVGRMVVDGDRIVFVDRLATIAWLAKDGSDCGTLIQGDGTDVSTAPNIDFALDADYLYVLDPEARKLARIARPAIGL